MGRQCYFQGCTQTATTREHIPPKAFFPEGQRDQLLTVPSCPAHNNAKSVDDTYVLAQICLNSSPNNQSRDMFAERVMPQLGLSATSLRAQLLGGAVPHIDGSVEYKVDVERVDRFFDALTCGILFKSAKSQLPAGYGLRHLYHNFVDKNATREEKALVEMIRRFYAGKPQDVLDFGAVKTMNKPIYSARIYGVPNYGSSITVTHHFFGTFEVTSMVSSASALMAAERLSEPLP